MCTRSSYLLPGLQLAVNGAMGFHGVICSATQLLKTPATSGPLPNNQNQPGSWSNAVAYLSLHGTADTTIPPAGGPLFGSSTFELHSVAESTRLFAELNGCELSPLSWSLDALIAGGPTTADVTTYSCDPTTPVAAYMVQGGGHGVAGSIGGLSIEALALDFVVGVEAAHESASGSPSPAFTTKWISQSNPFVGEANTILVSLTANVPLPEGSTVSIMGLTGAQTPDTASLAVDAHSCNLGTSGHWYQSTGFLTVATTAGGIASGASCSFSFSLTNPTWVQVAPAVSVGAVLLDASGSHGGVIEMSLMTKPGTDLHGVALGSDPLTVAVAAGPAVAHNLTLSSLMDPAVSHCRLELSWKHILSDLRFRTGGLGKLMVPDVFEVWVCDMMDPCLKTSATAAGDAMCYAFNETSSFFVPLASNSRVRFVRS